MKSTVRYIDTETSTGNGVARSLAYRIINQAAKTICGRRIAGKDDAELET
jgi:hypothetical protein